MREREEGREGGRGRERERERGGEKWGGEQSTCEHRCIHVKCTYVPQFRQIVYTIHIHYIS